MAGLLTNRQRECLIHIARGLSAAEVADVMYLETRTVQYHLSKAFIRLGVHNRIQAVNEARRLREIP